MTAAKAKAKRLRPGELDELVLAYLSERKEEGPLTARAIGKGIGRSSGAIANCLARLAKEKTVRQAKRKPRAYALKEAK
jgi:DNA-binding PadR family transcriptional regulator